MLFGRCKPTPLPEAARMGFRSRLVLAKLGFDLRQRYDDLLGRELPDELGRLASQLNPRVVEVGNELRSRLRDRPSWNFSRNRQFDSVPSWVRYYQPEEDISNGEGS